MTEITARAPLPHGTADGAVGPRGLPLVGVAPRLRRDPLRYFVEMLLTYGDVVWFDVGRDRVVMLNDPEHIKHVLQVNHGNYHKSKFYAPLRPMLGNGIFLSEDEEWLEQRRTAAPAFGGHRVEHMAEQVVGAGRDMLARWEGYRARGESFDLLAETMHVTLDGVMRAFLDVRLSGGHAAIHHALAVILRETERRVWSVVPIPQALATRTNPAYRRALATLDRVIAELIEQRRADPREDDLLSMLIAACDGPARRNAKLLRDQVVSIVTAGHETTAIALAWAFCLLSRNPAVERRLHEEVDRVLQGRTPGWRDLGQLAYTRMVFEEAMRLYPPVWTISRVAVADDRIGDLRISKGTTVMLSPYAVHRHPRIWENPEGFDPERFAPAAVERRPRYAYFPFGGGPRTCLGNRFSILEAQLLMALIVQRYRVDLQPECRPQPEPMITLRPRDRIEVALRSRQPAPARRPDGAEASAARQSETPPAAAGGCPFHDAA